VHGLMRGLTGSFASTSLPAMTVHPAQKPCPGNRCPIFRLPFSRKLSASDFLSVIVQAATERLLVRAYVAYERLAGFDDVPDSYTGGDALRGCDHLVRLARAEPGPPVQPPVQPAPPPAPVVRCFLLHPPS